MGSTESILYYDYSVAQEPRRSVTEAAAPEKPAATPAATPKTPASSKSAATPKTPATPNVPATPKSPMSALSAVNCPLQSRPVVMGQLEFLDDPRKIQLLNNGATFFAFRCCVATNFTPKEQHIMDLCSNLSSFPNEVKDNNVPHFNVYDPNDAKKYTCIMTKAAYMLPKIQAEAVRPDILASYAYQKACQPPGTYVWPQKEGDTFRITKTVIKLVYKITIQLKVSALSREVCDRLSVIDGLPVHHALLMERTKRNSRGVDYTKKAKSLLLYSNINGGTLVSHFVLVLNTAIPKVIAPIIGQVGIYGCMEGARSAELARHYLCTYYNLPLPANNPNAPSAFDGGHSDNGLSDSDIGENEEEEEEA